MMPGTTGYLEEPAIETYAIGFERMIGHVRDLLATLICIMRHILAILVFPIYLLAVGYCTILIPEAFPHHPLTRINSSPTLNSVDTDSSSHESQSPDECVKGASVDHLRIPSPNPPPASPDYPSLPPAIPEHLKECEFYYNDVNVDLATHSPTLDLGGQRKVRLHVDRVTRTCTSGHARAWLEVLESQTGDGDLEPGEQRRAQLELGDRVYVGPASWLIRVLMEEA